MSSKMPSQPISRLTSMQSRCLISDSVLYPIGSGKFVSPEKLYKNLLNYVLYQECSIDLASKFFSCKLLQHKLQRKYRLFTFAVKFVYDFRNWKKVNFCAQKKSSKSIPTTN